MPLELDPEVVINKALDTAAGCIEAKPKVAYMILSQLLRVDKENQQAHAMLGLVCYRLGHKKEAVQHLHEAIRLKSDDAESYNNMALVYAAMGNYEESARWLEDALRIKPDQYLFLNNLALQWKQLGEHQRAIECFERALAIKTEPMVLCNLGGLYTDLKRWEDAKTCYNIAISVNPDIPAPKVFLSYVHGYLGDWETAFRLYENRFQHFEQLQFYNRAYDPAKRWCGTLLSGKRIILYGEQGWGDQLQYVRYVHQVKAAGGYTIVHCAKPLKTLFDRLPFVDETFTDDIVGLADNPQSIPPHDFHCSLISLPFCLKDFVPTGEPYIRPGAVLRIREVEEYRHSFNVGIAWAGSPMHPNDLQRSMPLKEFEPLQLEGVRLFNLQVGGSKRHYPPIDATVDFAAGGQNVRLVDLTPMMTDYEQSAAVISGLDLIISVDTSVVHLAGAMGVPCWVLLPQNSDWRWGTEGDSTDWYDSLRLFRQGPGGWSALMQQVREELSRVVSR